MMKKALMRYPVLCMFILLVPVFISKSSAVTSDVLDIGAGNVILSTPGDYTITGATTQNYIGIVGSGTYNITLKGVTIDLTNSKTVPIQISDSISSVNLILADSSESTINSSTYYAIDCGCPLTISGNGKLTTNAQISSDDTLTISLSGNIISYSGFSSNNDFKINGIGNVFINTDVHDGIISYRGSIDISQGNVRISSLNGINSREGNVSISGGQLDILCTGKYSGIGVSANNINISKNSTVNINATNEVSSAYGIHGGFTMSGGTLKINASGTGIDTGTLNYINKTDQLTAGTFKFTGGTIIITCAGVGVSGIYSMVTSISNEAKLKIDVSGTGSTGINAYTRDASVNISGGSIDISGNAYGIKCYKKVEITGGSTTIKVTCDKSDNLAIGIYSYLDKVVISGGTVISVTSRPSLSAGISTVGIHSYYGPDISGGKITAEGATSALESITKSISIYSNMLINAGSSDKDISIVQKYNNENYVNICPQTEWKNPYTDVINTDWFFNNVAFVNIHGLLTGTDESAFSPNQNLSRAMISTILWRMADKPEPTGKVVLSDVASNSYCSKAATWSVENSIMVCNTSGFFDADTYSSREQLILALYRYAKYRNYDVTANAKLSDFTDADKVSADASDAMKWAIYKGIISGTNNGALEPKSLLTRAQFAAILQRFIEMKNT